MTPEVYFFDFSRTSFVEQSCVSNRVKCASPFDSSEVWHRSQPHHEVNSWIKSLECFCTSKMIDHKCYPRRQEIMKEVTQGHKKPNHYWHLYFGCVHVMVKEGQRSGSSLLLHTPQCSWGFRLLH